MAMHTGPYIYLRWENADNQRYYEVHLQQDLFNAWCLTKVWVRKNTPLGQMRHTPCADYENGLQKIDIIAKQRHQRGYDLQNSH